jgi:hypothetical protein
MFSVCGSASSPCQVPAIFGWDLVYEFCAVADQSEISSPSVSCFSVRPMSNVGGFYFNLSLSENLSSTESLSRPTSLKLSVIN